MRRRLSLLVKIEGDPLTEEEEAEEVVIQWSLLANIEGDPLNRRRRRALLRLLLPPTSLTSVGPGSPDTLGRVGPRTYPRIHVPRGQDLDRVSAYPES